jgi:protein gp37
MSIQETVISWTKHTNNPVRFINTETGKIEGWHCQKVSDGCKFCYAETMNMRIGSKLPFTPSSTKKLICTFDDKMAAKLYTIKEPNSKVFMFDMTDIFGTFVPDYVRAAAWCMMLSLPQHIFQVLTKRPESAILWHERFAPARASDEFKALVEKVTDKRVKSALQADYPTVWPSHLWMGTSVEDSRVVHRIDALRKTPAAVRFLSCEPLIGPLGQVNLDGIHWVIVGGESGTHMVTGHERWMQQSWARELRDRCVNQGVAYFYKQDSGHRTELRTHLVEEDGSRWKWEQWPDNFVPAVNIDTGEIWTPSTYRGYRSVDCPDYNWGSSKPFAAYEAPIFEPLLPAVDQPKKPTTKTTVVNFHDVKEHWDAPSRKWDSDEYVYVGRWNGTYNLPESPFHNPFKLTVDTPDNRAAVLEQFREYITKKIKDGLLNPNVLYGKKLVCWCSPKPCHAEVLVEILHPASVVREQAKVLDTPQQPNQPQQLTLF